MSRKAQPQSISVQGHVGPGTELHMNTTTKAPIGTTCHTGERCRESGVWEVVGTPSTTAPIAKGNVFPPYGGRSVNWRLIRYA